jgi:hypothetical protein
MTKLRHDRPILRYLDNLRRENDLALAPIVTRPISKAEKPAARRLLRPRDEGAYERHIDAFDRLPEQSRNVIDRLFEQANVLLNARMEYIQSIGTRKNMGKKQVRYQHELNGFRDSCIAYNRHCASQTRDGKSPAREWFAKLRVIMGSEWTHFEEMDDTIAETRRA